MWHGCLISSVFHQPLELPLVAAVPEWILGPGPFYLISVSDWRDPQHSGVASWCTVNGESCDSYAMVTGPWTRVTGAEPTLFAGVPLVDCLCICSVGNTHDSSPCLNVRL